MYMISKKEKKNPNDNNDKQKKEYNNKISERAETRYKNKLR